MNYLLPTKYLDLFLLYVGLCFEKILTLDLVFMSFAVIVLMVRYCSTSSFHSNENLEFINWCAW